MPFSVWISIWSSWKPGSSAVMRIRSFSSAMSTGGAQAARLISSLALRAAEGRAEGPVEPVLQGRNVTIGFPTHQIHDVPPLNEMGHTVTVTDFFVESAISPSGAGVELGDVAFADLPREQSPGQDVRRPASG